MLHAVDPGRLHAAWWMSAPSAEALRALGGGRMPPLFLRVVEGVGEAATAFSTPGHVLQEIALEEPALAAEEVEGSRFLQIEGVGRFFRVELRVADSGRQIVVARSNVVERPGFVPARVAAGATARPATPRPGAPQPDEPYVREPSLREPHGVGAERSDDEPTIVPADAALASSSEDDALLGRAGEPAETERRFEPPSAVAAPSGPVGIGTVERVALDVPLCTHSGEVEEPANPPSSSLETRTAASSARLEIAADIVIYGATRPGTEVVIDGEVIPVAADGTFSFRIALPGGKAPDSSWVERKPTA